MKLGLFQKLIAICFSMINNYQLYFSFLEATRFATKPSSEDPSRILEYRQPEQQSRHYLQLIEPLDTRGKMKFVNITGKWWLPILEEKQRLSLENFIILTLRKTVLKLNLWLSTVHVISNKSNKIQSSSFLTVFHQNSKIHTITLLQINDTACTHPSSHPSNQDRKKPLKDHQPKQKGLPLLSSIRISHFTKQL